MGYSNLHELVVCILASFSTSYDYRPFRGGHGWKFFFPNGYGVSIVKHDFSYGGDADLWELAALRGKSIDNFELFYCDITYDDVVGGLTEKELIELARKVSKL